jgi:thiol-disulfide isomerase/thioredoxin
MPAIRAIAHPYLERQPLRRWSVWLLCWLAFAWPAIATAQATSPFVLEGNTLSGKKLSIKDYRGKVLMLYYWSTDCAVCRDKLPELRANADGWRGKPFQIVGINVDKRRSDALAYEQASTAALKPEQRFPSLWRGDAEFRDSLPAAPGKLPLTLLLDDQGRVVKRFEGRIPADAWDTIADLLP